jgi:pectin methylesterase-like acyl-CoA thioesterase
MSAMNSVFGPLAAVLAAGALLSAAAAAPPAPSGARSPACGAANVCPDTPLRIVFSSPPSLGASGRIEIHDAADGSVVDAIDVSRPTATETIGGLPGFNYRPVVVTGDEAAIYPRKDALAYGRAYYVTLDAGVLMVGKVPCAATTGPEDWRFTTRASPPPDGSPRLVVAADGTGDFCTVQGALDFIPEGNTAPVTVFIRNGTYDEIVFLAGRNNVTLLGEDRRRTVIAYANNERFNPAGGNPYAGSSDPSEADRAHGHIYRRGVFLAHRVDGLVISNLTLRNTTPRGGSQAEALILNGAPDARAVVRDADLYSFQDTLQVNGQAFVSGCRIEGDVDFMWGTGPCYFEACVCRSVRSGGFYTQVRNPAGHHGFVFDRCTFEGAPGVTGNFLSRVEPARFPYSEVVLLDCTLTGAVGPAGWLLQATPGASPPAIAEIHFWESASRDPEGRPLRPGSRMPGSRELAAPADAPLIESYRDPRRVLGDGWSPETAAPRPERAGGQP